MARQEFSIRLLLLLLLLRANPADRHPRLLLKTPFEQRYISVHLVRPVSACVRFRPTAPR